MIIENQILTIKWSRVTKKYYEQKGYVFTKMNDEFEIDIKDLHEGSAMNVEFICDYCNGKNQISEESKYRPYRNLLRPRKGVNKKDSCNNKDCIRMRILETESTQGIPKGKSLQDKFPIIASQWDYTKNEKTPSDYRFASTKEVWWKCENGHEWSNTIVSRTGHNSGCPYCVNQRVNESNCLATTHSHIANEWNYEKNNDITPYDVTYGSTKIVWWICKNKHEWKSTVGNRTYGYGCPYCSNQKANNENCLYYLFPEMADEWHPTKNGDFTPYNTVSKSNKKVWWLGKCGHEWEAMILDRTSKNTGCPYCSGKRVNEDNSLATLNKKLANEWDNSKNNITPKDVTLHSNKKVWWICEKCKHEWRTTVSHRSSGKGCPKCAESKGEKRVKEWICKNNIKNISQYSYDDLLGVGGSPLRFDFAVFDKNDNLYKLIEYDGEFHFKKQYYNDSYDKIVEHDRRKNEYCKNNNIPLLRIPYWDFDRIEEILESELILENESMLI